ncbi:MAG: thiouridylase [Firmicutes bacterium]|nr:thiouridylase [Bacillota bacterium]
MSKKVAVGMSGGVDSSVAAYLLKEQGYDVIGINMQVWQEDGCSSSSAAEDARRVADKLGIPFHVVDFKECFKEWVIDYFIDEYMNGRTPNPCVACNKHIKFGELLKAAMALGADYVATGHYAVIEEKGGRYLLKNAEDDKKDQTYMLYGLTQHQLAHTLMPCGAFRKDRIREIAKEIGLLVHNKKDSEDICFIPDKDHGGFIKRQVPGRLAEGNFVDKNGKVLGRHKGIAYYTIGQRKGLGIALGIPVFVTDIIPWRNEVVLGSEEEIFKTELMAKDVNFIPFDTLEEPIEVRAKIRYAAKPSPAVIYPESGNRVRVVFAEKQRAITKGQSVVFYDGSYLVGGGVIESIL